MVYGVDERRKTLQRVNLCQINAVTNTLLRNRNLPQTVGGVSVASTKMQPGRFDGWCKRGAVG